MDSAPIFILPGDLLQERAPIQIILGSWFHPYIKKLSFIPSHVESQIVHRDMLKYVAPSLDMPSLEVFVGGIILISTPQLAA
jgi:hypothetical protein